MPIERWLITGASGNLGGHLVRQLAADAGPKTIVALGGTQSVVLPPLAAGVELVVRQIDLRKPGRGLATLTDFDITHVVHAAALTSVADAFARPAEADQINVRATAELAEWAARRGARMVFVSTDMVFAGTSAPYRETDPPDALSVYGRSKAEAERRLDRARDLIARVPLMYGFPCTPRDTTFARQLAALRAGAPLRLFTDEFRTPAWVADVAVALIGSARAELTGVIHVGGRERLSRFEMVGRFAALLGIAKPNLVPVSRLSVASSEPRPADLSLNSTRLAGLFPALCPGPIRAAAFE
jgi:dTDP-4-dehydrorhamnose reductase